MLRRSPFWCVILVGLACALSLFGQTPANESTSAPPAVPSTPVEEEPVSSASPPPVAAAPSSAPAQAETPRLKAVVIPIREEIAPPVLYILRRGLKEAIEAKVDLVVLDMKTPGGRLDVTFEMMEALDKFPGKTVTYVNSEAISAGAFISATTDEIWFAPEGVIGAAAPVMSGGQEIDASMKQKIVSYLRARVRAISEGKGYRGQVISAMIDADYELKVDDQVLKPKGELLSLTASEAAKTYGTPPQPLLAAGIAPDLAALLQTLGARKEDVRQLTVTWSEEVAVFLNSIAPVLLALGLLAGFIEFKTPGFGIFGIASAALLALVFFGHYIAGFSGHEPILVFVIGLVAVVAELLFFPGVLVVALLGLVLMLGALVWSMADLWPNEPITLSGDLFVAPLINVGFGLVMAVVLMVLLARFLPKGWFWDRMVLSASISGTAGAGTLVAPSASTAVDPLIGRRGVAVTPLVPAGQIEVDGKRFEATLSMGFLERGSPVLITGKSGFEYTVTKADA